MNWNPKIDLVIGLTLLTVSFSNILVYIITSKNINGNIIQLMGLTKYIIFNIVITIILFLVFYNSLKVS